MSLKGRQTFIRKTNPLYLYKWTPFDNDKKRVGAAKGTGKQEYCTAIPNSQGNDNKTQYVYKIVNGEKKAYVACDYVK